MTTLDQRPGNTSYDLLKRRRDISRALQESAMAPYKQQMVSGRVVPYNIGDAIGTLGSAYFGNKAERQAQEGLTKGTSEATQRVIEQMQGRGAVGQQGPQIPVEADPMGAQLTATTNPFLSDNKALQAVMLAQATAKAGGANPYFTPEDVVTKEGDRWVVNKRVLNRRTGKYVDGGKEYLSKDDPRVRGLRKQEEAGGTIRGEETTTASIDLPKTEYSANYLKDIATRLRDHPGMSDVIGIPNILTAGGLVPGTQGADFRELYKQLEGGAFLEAYETLKGGGQITEIEGAKATAAKIRMGKAQTETSFKSALNEFLVEVDKLTEIARRRAGGGIKETPNSGAITDFSKVPPGWDAEDYKYLTDKEKREAHGR